MPASQEGRGNIAQIKAQEVLSARVEHLHSKIDAVLQHLQIPVPSAPAQMQMLRETATLPVGADTAIPLSPPLREEE